LFGLGLNDLLRVRARGASQQAPARSAILLWLWGGPSHLDTFDMKPAAPAAYRGPYRPVATNVPGVEISELLPRLARRADRYALVRSLHHESNDHGIAGTIGLTSSSAGALSLGGKALPGLLEPAWGSIVARRAPAQADLPGFVSLGGYLHQGKQRIAGEGGARLGPACDPFRLDYDPATGIKLPEWQLVDGLSADGLGSLVDLRERFNRLSARLDESRAAASLDRYYQQALSLLTSGAARSVFDLDGEPEALRRRYGKFRFGQCCLIARRLVEAEVGFVQVNWSSHVEPVEDAGDGGWDMHDRNFPQLQDRHCWMLDQALSALLDDLEQRGLLESTVVVAVGEFGRSPRINNRAGRDHWEHCYSAMLAGGGIRGGQVVGASDRRGEFPAKTPVKPGDLATTVFERLGIRAPELTDLGLTPQGTLIEELT
ncbi:MAG TPA: DUF1501 domain-containing protein, partial [Pirellulales bacterium]|nr:DUF1501 domain-containing protein [Pirellulales bacterium]